MIFSAVFFNQREFFNQYKKISMKKTVIIFCVQGNQKVANLSRLEVSLFKDNIGD